jgi:hypothetical protein
MLSICCSEWWLSHIYYGTYVSSIDISYDVFLEAYLLDVFGACIWNVFEIHIGTCI